jgi:CRISPR-associated protein Cmr5
MTNGLAAALAFAVEKKGAYLLIYRQIEEWIGAGSLIDYVCGLNSAEYRVVTDETIALFEWLRRFASGLIEGEAEIEGGGR